MSSYAEEQAARLRQEREAPFNPTHTYQPIGMDQFDPTVLQGGPVKPGDQVEYLREHTKGLRSGTGRTRGDRSAAGQFINVVCDAQGNQQRVSRNSLSPVRRGVHRRNGRLGLE